MRRRLLAPLQRGLRVLSAGAPSHRQLRCAGLWATLAPAATLPQAARRPAWLFQLVGPGSLHRLACARRKPLACPKLPIELPQLFAGQCETMPFRDGSFQAVSCIFLLCTELPGEARQETVIGGTNVSACSGKPAGTLVLGADSGADADLTLTSFAGR